MKFAVLALLGLVSMEEIAAKHHHHQHKKHHKHQHHQSLAQAEPAKAAAPPAVTPASNRATFEKSVAEAAATVATQQKFETTKTADVASRNAANTKETFDLKKSVRDARQNQIENEVHHAQWVTRSNHSNWAQISSNEEPAADAKAADKKAEAKDAKDAKDSKEAGDKADAKSKPKAKKQNPQNSYDEKAASLKVVLETTAAQRAFEAKSNADVAAAQAKYADSAENIKNAVRINRRIQANGGLNHDDKELYLGGKRSYEIAQVSADPAPADKKDDDKEDKPKTQNPNNSYKEKADSLKEVLEVTKAQRAFERKSNADVAAAQAKYAKQTEDKKNEVRVARRIQANGGLDQRGSFGKFSSSLAQGEPADAKDKAPAPLNPDGNRKTFEKQVAEAAKTVDTQEKFEAKKTADVASRDAANVKETFNEKARVRAGRVAMMRGGPPERYGGGHRKPEAAKDAGSEKEKPAQSLAQAQSSSTDSESEEEEQQIMAQRRRQARKAKKHRRAARARSSSSSSSDSD